MTLTTPALATDLGLAIRAEWTKLRSLRSTYWLLAAYAAISIGLGAALVNNAVNHHVRGRSPAATGSWYHGLEAGQVVLAILGALMASGEYGTGTIRTTLAAVPVRGRVLAAKAITIGLASAVLGAVTAFAAFALAQPILARHGLSVSLIDPTALRGVALATVASTGVGLLGLALGLIIRHTAGAIAAATMAMLGLAAIAASLPPSWAATKYVLPQPEFGILTPNSDYLRQAPATAVFFGYVAVLLAIAAVSFQRRDAS